MFDPAKETDVERLQVFGSFAVRQVELLHKHLTELSAENDQLKRQQRGSELQRRLDLLECQLNQAPKPEPKPSKPAKKQKARRGHGPTAQPQLEQPELICNLDLPDQQCPGCGGQLEAIKDQFERSEMVDHIEVRYVLHQVKRQKYSCRCGHIETALGPDRSQHGGRYSLRFGIHVAIQKFLDHLPLTRQARMMVRQGLHVSKQTLWDQLFAISQLLRPTYEALWTHVLGQPVIGVDQTCWLNLTKRPKKHWQLWAATCEDAAVYSICKTKGTDDFLRLFGGYQGTMVCDAASTHTSGARASPGIKLAGCWAHVLRKFRDAEPNFPNAGEFLTLIGRLYEIDRRATSRDERQRLRAAESVSVLDEMRRCMTSTPMLKSTEMGRAMAYTHRFWDRLTRFAHDPDVWLDNNRTERGIRGPVVGRKNYYGCKTERGTEVAAIVYTLVETAKLNGLNPQRYLLAVARHALHNTGKALSPKDYLSQKTSD